MVTIKQNHRFIIPRYTVYIPMIQHGVTNINFWPDASLIILFVRHLLTIICLRKEVAILVDYSLKMCKSI